jgi:hypothetical protein
MRHSNCIRFALAATPWRERWIVVRLLHPSVIRRRVCCFDGAPNCEHCRVHEALNHVLGCLYGVLSWYATGLPAQPFSTTNTLVGNFVGPLLFKTKDAPVYAPGFVAVLATSIAAAVLAVVYRYVCIWENRKRDSTGTMEGFDHAYQDDLTDRKNPQFRYTL